MAQKSLSLPEDIYNKLKSVKREKETFPELILRLLNENNPQNSPPIDTFFGAFEDESDQWGKIEEKLYEKRLRPSGRKSNK
jgi:predicted CopG family antitoxin